MVVARSQGGAVLGGYNPLGYDGYGNKATLGAFLFTWPDGDMNKTPHKLPKISTDQMAIVDGLDKGIHFGPGDLKILLERGMALLLMAACCKDAFQLTRAVALSLAA